GEVLLRADDPEELSRWYTERLGVDAGTGDSAREPRPDGRTTFTAAATGPRGWALTFRTPDLTATVAALRGTGTTVDTDPDGRSATLHDPEGNPVRLWQPDAASTAWSPEPSYVRAVDENPAGKGDAVRAARAGRRRWLPWLPLVLAVAVAAVFVTTTGGENVGEETPAPSSPAAPGLTTAAPPPVEVTNAGPRLLGVTAGWELFAHGEGQLIRVELAEGRVTRTRLPGLNTTGPAFLVVGPDSALVHPNDHVSGYLVPDGEPPRELPVEARHGGHAYPGPEPGTMWVQAQEHDRNDLSLVTLDGEPAGSRVPVPADGHFWPQGADGTGHVLGNFTDGTYLARPDGLHRVTTGALLAAGPTRYLLVECDDRARCSRVVVDRATGDRRVLPGSTAAAIGAAGPVSPDGAFAAYVPGGPAGSGAVTLVDLASGRDHRIGTPRALDPGTSLVFSPDGRWLFLPGGPDGLLAVDTRTKRTRQLPFELPGVGHVAVRSADWHG
ncbi:VOC family protein, partial [Qaidamihabitans albus]|uniref:VOC family protein n=1 Tax=Qaidamihabitans albus TaxID=2795733 RepID=UPI0018F15A03